MMTCRCINWDGKTCCKKRVEPVKPAPPPAPPDDGSSVMRRRDQNAPDVPKGWHVSWMGMDDGAYVCQIKRHDLEGLSCNAITFVSRKAMSQTEAYRDAVFTVMEEMGKDYD